jgi:thiol:disulfide interchange protein DsbD
MLFRPVACRPYIPLLLLLLFAPVELLAGASEKSPSLRAFLESDTREVVLEISLPPDTYTYIASPAALPLALDADKESRAFFGDALLPPYQIAARGGEPAGIQKDDELIARGDFVLRLPFLSDVRPEQAARIVLRLRMQICDEALNLCFPPKVYALGLTEHAERERGGVSLSTTSAQQSRGEVSLSEQRGDMSSSTASAQQSRGGVSLSNKGAEKRGDGILSSLSEDIAERMRGFAGNFAGILLLAFLGGVLTSLTPCVYPVIPVILAFFAQEGTGEGGLARRRFSGAFAYVLGMSCVYTALGLIAGLLGGAFASVVSTPPFFIAVAILFYVLALSLVDVIPFRLPNFMDRTRGGGAQNERGRKGGMRRAFVMGLMSGIVVSPCVGPVVFFILTEVLQQGEAGSGALFMLAFSLGMGVLFFILALLGKRFSRVLRAGGWMLYIKIALAVLVLLSAMHFLHQGLYAALSLPLIYLVQSLFILAMILLAWRHFKKEFAKTTPYALVTAFACLLCVCLLFPSASQPLAWGDDLDSALAGAQARGQKVFIDVGAVWCAACRELEERFAADANLRSLIEAKAVPVRLDYDIHEERLARDYDVRALPCLLILDASGRLKWKKGGFASMESLASEISNALSD